MAMPPHDDDIDVALVEMLLQAIRKGQAPGLVEIETPLVFLRQELGDRLAGRGDAQSKGGLQQLLRDHSALGDAIDIVCRETLEFVANECARFQEIKRRRPLTEAEKRYGTDCLLPLLGGLSEFANSDLHD